MDLSQAHILVVGASGALGGLVSTELAGRGARLALSGRDAGRLSARADELHGVSIPADLREVGAPARVVGEASARLGRLDAVVQCAGVVAFGPVHSLDDATLNELIDTNLLAPIRLTRAALGELTRPGGVIVNVSAIVAEMPTAGMAAYSASKAALSAFDHAAAREARREGLRVIDVRPPHLDTGLETRPIVGEAPPLKQGRPAGEVARAIADALVDDRAREADIPKSPSS